MPKNFEEKEIKYVVCMVLFLPKLAASPAK